VSLSNTELGVTIIPWFLNRMRMISAALYVVSSQKRFSGTGNSTSTDVGRTFGTAGRDLPPRPRRRIWKVSLPRLPR